ncbi:NAD(P)-binding protein [Meredithblackwellia eburnea MCA 4105]
MATVWTFLYEQFLVRNLALPTASLEGLTVLVTGANRGLGLHTCIHLGRLQPARLILACRDVRAGEAASLTIQSEARFKGEIVIRQLDLASLSSVKAFAETCKLEERLDIVVLNAGIGMPSFIRTMDGWETTIQVNALATGLLALLLLPQVAATQPIPGSNVAPHITIVGSEVHVFAAFKEKNIPGSTLEALNKPELANFHDRYNVSKVLDLFIARQLAKLPLVRSHSIVVNVVNPGLCKSSFREGMGLSKGLQWVLNLMARSTSEGAKNFAWAAVERTPPGAYVSSSRVAREAAWTTNESGLALEQKLWGEMSQVWVEVAPETAKILRD